MWCSDLKKDFLALICTLALCFTGKSTLEFCSHIWRAAPLKSVHLFTVVQKNIKLLLYVYSRAVGGHITFVPLFPWLCFLIPPLVNPGIYARGYRIYAHALSNCWSHKLPNFIVQSVPEYQDNGTNYCCHYKNLQ